MQFLRMCLSKTKHQQIIQGLCEFRLVDCLSDWWQKNQLLASAFDEWVINLDSGSATLSNRTQFIKRMVELSQKINLKIHLVYYPPYHSKYNPIERCWAALENYWHSKILDSVDAAVRWASNMTWKGISAIVHLVETAYEKGVKLLPEDLKQYFPSWQRSDNLPKWDITIAPS